MTKEQKIQDFLIKKPGYLKKHPVATLYSLFKTKYSKKDVQTTKEIQRKLKTLEKPYEKEVPKSIVQEILSYKASNEATRPNKVLFLDIEVSPNLVFSWGVGNKISLGPENIVHERAIICISYKWQDEKEVKSLQWNNGDDKQVVQKIAKIMEQATHIVGHNSFAFDNKWIKGRMLFHGIHANLNYKDIDTLKLARKYFRLNSNKLDYISRYLGLGKKKETGYNLWKDIVLKNDKQSMKKMVEYCNNDVLLLEKVYKKILPFETKK